MMGNLLARGEQLARVAQQRRLAEVANQLTELLRGATITVEEALVLVSGKGLLKRWLIDPQLRFLAGDRR
jgi:hypothetical protein